MRILLYYYFSGTGKIYFLYLCSTKSSRIPNKPQDNISPMPTVSMKKGMEPGMWYAKYNTGGTINVLATMGGRGASHLQRRSRYVPTAPSSVARLPKTTSQMMAPVNRLLIRHPRNRPGMAAGVKKGNMVSASEKRSWMA